MVLLFEFHYTSQNGVLQSLLQNICEDFEIKYGINQSNTVVKLEVEAQEETLESFSNFLSVRLPLSIFFKSSSVSVIDELSENSQTIKCSLALPYTPKALQEVQDEQSPFYLSPFVQNEVGVSPFLEAKKLKLREKDGSCIKMAQKDSSEFSQFYKEIINLLKAEKRVLIKSPAGDFIYSIVSSKNAQKVAAYTPIVATDLSSVEKMVVIKDNEIKALASLEKPCIRLKVNSLYEAKNILPYSRVKIQLADDMLLCLLAQEAYKNGIEFLFKEEKSEQYEYEVLTDQEVSKIPSLEICVLENGEILILNGEGYSAPSIKENMKKFDDTSYAQFTSVIQEHDLFKERVSGFYLSKTHDDKFMHISDKTGMLDLVSFRVEKNFEKLFESIKASTTGAKLFENYEKQYPNLIKKALQTDIPQDASDSIYTMWKICSMVLGFSEDFESAGEKLIELAEDFGGQKGPRIDYTLLDPKALTSQFDFIKMLRSSMSFKLAGADDKTLSFGFLEALAYFLSDSADFYKENLTSERIVLCGSLFGIKRFCEVVARNIQSTNKISFNKELPIDS
jgi:hypothetical protein